MQFPVLQTIFRERSSAAVCTVIAAGLFMLQYRFLANLPGTDGYRCIPGANLTPENIAFAAVVAILSGLVGAGVVQTARNHVKLRGIDTASLSSFGLLAAVATGFCAVCALPALSLFGASIGLGFLNDHRTLLRMLSIVLLFAALFRVNWQLQGHCRRCAA